MAARVFQSNVGEVLGHNRSKFHMFPSPTGYIMLSFSFLILKYMNTLYISLKWHVIFMKVEHEGLTTRTAMTHTLCHDWCVSCPKPITSQRCDSLPPSVVTPSTGSSSNSTDSYEKKGHFKHETESSWPVHFKHSHWWKWSRSKLASHYDAWGTNGVCECKMDVKFTWIPTWHWLDHVSWSLVGRPNTKSRDHGTPNTHNR